MIENRLKVPIILASASPRRKAICDLLGLNFTIQAPFDEPTISKHLPYDAATLQVAKAKADEVALFNKGACIIGADTIVVDCEGVVLGKPKDENHAFKMLKTLQGRTHTVITAVWIHLGEPCESSGFTSTTKVDFCPMSDDEIWEYIKTGEPMDKAGSYGIQGAGMKYISGIFGDFYSVMGLPASRLYKALKDLEIV